ncbi:hypothetical protein LZ24_01553 [Desulfobotulus alkaliphilus]|uniref:Uncharacterized protein n=1 Tax=Desulfobotulus alkaliphilus TaxID=622671 RepID=A0A562RTI5_9BACT|nr:hypothetical protein [Desulfobotulus alkaliphilus]TWI72411.1 hypothetical protein LZ24_01553 [Desulfobotulus alkaliphilus]
MKNKFFFSGNAMLWVALFLILLAFFAFLNALSSPDIYRGERVLQSVRTGFGSVADLGALRPGVWRYRFDEPGVMELTALVSRLGPEGRYMVDAQGNFWIRFPQKALFGPESHLFSGEGKLLMEDIRAAIPEHFEGKRIMVHARRKEGRSPDAALRETLLRGLAVAEVMGSAMQVWGFGDLVPEFAYGQGRDEENARVLLVFSGRGSSGGGPFMFRDFFFRVFSENP